jgi:AcrR family transcriptional regulator
VRTADPIKNQRIFDAAAQLFAERHYHEVRMDDIAAKAGVAKGTIYFHFKDKDTLYQALALDSLKRLSERLRDSLADLHDPATKLLGYNREAIRFFEQHAFALDLIQRMERIQDSDECGRKAFFELRDGFMKILRTILGELPQAAHKSEHEIALAVLACSGSIREVLQRLPRPWPSDLPEQLTRLFLDGFLLSATSDPPPIARRRTAEAEI